MRKTPFKPFNKHVISSCTKDLRKIFTSMRTVMVKEEKKVSFSELLRKLYQRSGARCEGYRLGLDCVVRLTEDLEPLIHHIDGNPRNNEISNLVLLCPNCHSEIMELLSEKRRKTYVKKVVKGLGKHYFGNRNS